MAFESDAERLAYIVEFGDTVEFMISGSQEGWDTYGIFDNEYVEVNGIESRHPVMQCRISDIYRPGEETNIPHRATSVQCWVGSFKIIEVQDDGAGMVQLILEMF